MLPKRCSGQLFSMPWRTRVTVVSCAEKPVGVPFCRARRAQPPRCAPPDATRPWCVRVLDSTGHVFRRLQIAPLKIECLVQSPDIPRAIRVGAHGGAAGRRRAGLNDDRTVRPGDKRPSYPPRHRRNVARTSLQKHEQAKCFLNRWRNTATG